MNSCWDIKRTILITTRYEGTISNVARNFDICEATVWLCWDVDFECCFQIPSSNQEIKHDWAQLMYWYV